jgi:hypothetical protein
VVQNILSDCRGLYLCTQVAESEGLCNLEQQSMTLSSILETHMQNPQPLYHEVVDAERAARDLQRVMQRRTLSPGASPITLQRIAFLEAADRTTPYVSDKHRLIRKVVRLRAPALQAPSNVQECRSM